MEHTEQVRPLEEHEYIVSPRRILASTISVHTPDAEWETRGFGGKATVRRSVALDQEGDGSWVINVHDPGDGRDDSGGTLTVTDPQLVYLVAMIADLIRDPDAFGTRVARMHDGPWTGPVASKGRGVA